MFILPIVDSNFQFESLSSLSSVSARVCGMCVRVFASKSINESNPYLYMSKCNYNVYITFGIVCYILLLCTLIHT